MQKPCAERALRAILSKKLNRYALSSKKLNRFLQTHFKKYVKKYLD